MEENTKRHVGNAIPRMILVGLSVLFQSGWLLLLILRLNRYSAWISLATGLLTLVVVVKLYSRHTAAALKLPWILLILALPVMGLSLYLLFGVFRDPGKVGKKLSQLHESARPCLFQNPDTMARLTDSSPTAANRARYLLEAADAPVYDGTKASYYGEAKDAFEAMKADLEKAEKFIFLEYFIVAEDSSFRELREILVRKAAEGVEVRLMYDDIGSVGYVNLMFARGLNEAGIRCRVFNPAIPMLNVFMNHRDHRKITVIDGAVGYTGGYNLADEYFGRKFPYGKWKDTGLRMEGKAVRSMTAAFLEMWNVQDKEPEKVENYLELTHEIPGVRGYVQPYGDNPLGPERLAENTLLNLVYSAEKYLYITTPYLIITDEMNHALGLAAKRGVDVRIVTPGIPDKKTVWQVTRSYYGGLAEQGVRIFEYEPGFIHAKQCLCDGIAGMIGTSNLDYRSLYYHFENNVLLYDSDALGDMAKDFAELFPQCREVTERYRSGRGRMLLLWQCLLRLFAPLM